VNAAKYFGYFFKGRDDDNNIEVDINGKSTRFQLLTVIEFSSDRKRMTVVVKTPDNKIKVMCKGADSIIVERLAKTERNEGMMEEVDQHLNTYAGSGLRTLLLAEKEITQEEYNEWKAEYRAASSAMAKRDEKMAEVAEKLETGFDLIGATAIEDKL
jgi:magnesium-transporting ATPase (P-type)